MYEGTHNDPAAIKFSKDEAIERLGWKVVALLAIICIGCLLRVLWLAGDPVWIDEAFTAILSVHPDFWQLVASDPNPPVYYLVMRGWASVAGISPWALKVPSLVFSIATLGVFAIAFRRVFSGAAVTALCLLSASSLVLIYYSSEARQYSLSILLCAVAAVLILHQANRTSLVRHIALFVVSGLLVATHILTVLPLFGFVVAALVLSHRHAWSLVLPVGGGAAFSLLVWFFLSNDAGQQAVSWLHLAQYGQLTVERLLSTPLTYLFGPGIGESDLFFKRVGGRPATHWHWFTLAAFSTGLTWLGIAAWRRREQEGALPLALLAGFIAAWCAFILVSLIQPLYVVGRYDVFLWPLFAVAAAALIGFGWQQKGAHRVLASTMVLVFVLSSASAYLSSARLPSTLDDTKAAAITEQLRRGDALLVLGEDNLPTIYQMLISGVEWQPGECRIRGLIIPCRMVANTPEHMAMDLDSSMNASFSARFDADWQSLKQASPRRWLVVNSQNRSAAAQQRADALAERFNELGAEVVSQSNVGGFSIYAVRRGGK